MSSWTKVRSNASAPDSIDRPAPTDLYRVVWPDGQRTAYASPDQYRNDFMGRQPVRSFEAGVTLEVVEDDGSEAFAKLRARAARSPIRECSKAV